MISMNHKKNYENCDYNENNNILVFRNIVI